MAFGLPSRDERPHRDKTKPLRAGMSRTEWGRQHPFCMACGAGEYGLHVLTTHELIGGRGGRSQEPCNWLRLGMHPCHDLATGLDVRDEYKMRAKYDSTGLCCGLEWSAPLLPKITLAIAIAMKIRCDELTEDDLDRLEVLNCRPLPDVAEIPEFFQRLWKQNRPELNRST